MAGRELTEEEHTSLKKHSTTVLRGNDPVLKLLDSRVQSFVRFACTWNQEELSLTTTSVEMRTGRTILTSDKDDARNHCMSFTRNLFSSAAKIEVSRLGFGFFGSDLIKVAIDARNIISLACTNYGHSILDRFINIDEGH